MHHLILFLIKLIFKGFDEQSKNNRGVLSSAQAESMSVWQRRQDMGDLSRKTKEHFIAALGEPNKIKDLDQAMQRLTWKGKKYRIDVEFNVVDQFVRIEESYS